jgi:hypothetical protein
VIKVKTLVSTPPFATMRSFLGKLVLHSFGLETQNSSFFA